MVVVVVVVVTTVRVLVGANVNCAMDGKEWWLIWLRDRVEDDDFGGETVVPGAIGFGTRTEGRRFILASCWG